MLFDLLHDGLELQLALPDGHEEVPAHVHDVAKDRVSIETATPLREGARIEVAFTSENGKYRFRSRVMETSEGGRRSDILPPRRVERRQAREFKRVDVEIPATFRVSEGTSTKEYEGMITNIAGGGLSMSVRKRLPEHEEILLSFSLARDSRLEDVKARIIKVERPTLEDYRYQIVAQFEDIRVGQQDRIVRYIFRREIEQKKSMEQD